MISDKSVNDSGEIVFTLRSGSSLNRPQSINSDLDSCGRQVKLDIYLTFSDSPAYTYSEIEDRDSRVYGSHYGSSQKISSKPSRIEIIKDYPETFHNNNNLYHSFNRKSTSGHSRMVNLKQDRSQNICKVCQKPVYIMERVVIHGSSFHKNCVKCCVCHRVLSVGAYTISNMNGKIYCEQHYKQLELHPENQKNTFRDIITSGSCYSNWRVKTNELPNPDVADSLIKKFNRYNLNMRHSKSMDNLNKEIMPGQTRTLITYWRTHDSFDDYEVY